MNVDSIWYDQRVFLIFQIVSVVNLQILYLHKIHTIFQDGTELHHGEVHLAAVPEVVAVLVVTAVAADSAVVEVLEGAVVVLEVAVAAVDEEDRIKPSLSFKNPSGVL